MLVRGLKRRGHTVHLATTISAAALTFRQGTVDIIVTDQHLPDGNGWSWACELNVKTVYMTGNPPPNPPSSFFYKGDDHITKLYGLIELMTP